MKDEEGWRRFCFGSKKKWNHKENNEQQNAEEELQTETLDQVSATGQVPSLPLMMRLNQVATMQLLHYHTQWLEETKELNGKIVKTMLTSVDWTTMWIFSLL